MSRSRPTDKFRNCRHFSTISVISEGVEHVICEECGDVTLRHEAMITGDVERASFSRPADGLLGGARAVAGGDSRVGPARRRSSRFALHRSNDQV